jgi:hypothetical protein
MITHVLPHSSTAGHVDSLFQRTVPQAVWANLLLLKEKRCQASFILEVVVQAKEEY